MLYCVKFNPEEEKQHLFVAGTADKKIVCVSKKLIKINKCIQFCKYLFLHFSGTQDQEI